MRTAAWPTPRSPAQCEAAGAAAAMRTAPVTAAAVLPGCFCSALAIADGLRCRAVAGSLAAARFDLRCLADLLDTARPPVGRNSCARWSPATPAVVARRCPGAVQVSRQKFPLG